MTTATATIPTPNTETKSKAPTKPKNVAEYIDWQIQLSGKKQFDIARESGFDKPNIVTMIKQGRTKLPLEKIGRFAKAIGVDPIHLLKLCLQEYMPETLTEIQRMFDQPILTQNEMEMIEVIRSAGVDNPRLRSENDRQRLLTFAKSLKGDNEAV